MNYIRVTHNKISSSARTYNTSAFIIHDAGILLITSNSKPKYDGYSFLWEYAQECIIGEEVSYPDWWFEYWTPERIDHEKFTQIYGPANAIYARHPIYTNKEIIKNLKYHYDQTKRHNLPPYTVTHNKIGDGEGFVIDEKLIIFSKSSQRQSEILPCLVRHDGYPIWATVCVDYQVNEEVSIPLWWKEKVPERPCDFSYAGSLPIIRSLRELADLATKRSSAEKVAKIDTKITHIEPHNTYFDEQEKLICAALSMLCVPYKKKY